MSVNKKSKEYKEFVNSISQIYRTTKQDSLTIDDIETEIADSQLDRDVILMYLMAMEEDGKIMKSDDKYYLV